MKENGSENPRIGFSDTQSFEEEKKKGEGERKEA